MYIHSSRTRCRGLYFLPVHLPPIPPSLPPLSVWEIPPNGQGLTALLALNLLASPSMRGKLEGLQHNSADYLHVLLEAMRYERKD